MRRPFTGGVRLSLTRWPGRALLFALGQLALLFAGCEWFARSTWARDHLPPPSMGFDRVFDAKVATLERLVAEGKRPDCIALGHSTTMWSFDPESVARSVRAASGRELRCFNLGMPGEPMEVVLAAGKYVVSWARPRLILVGDSFEGNWELRTPPRAWPAIRPSFESLLIERSMSYRYLLLARHALVPYLEGRVPEGMTDYGFVRSKARGAPASVIRYQQAALRQAPGTLPWIPWLSWLPLLRGMGAPVLLFDTPPHPDVRRAFVETARGPGVSRQQAQNEGYVVLAPPDGLLRAEHYIDGVHMNADGARVFSEWLGAEIVRSGAVW